MDAVKKFNIQHYSYCITCQFKTKCNTDAYGVCNFAVFSGNAHNQ